MWIVISNSLDIDFIDGDIHGWLCKKIINVMSEVLYWITSDKKSLFMLTHTLFYFLRAILWSEHTNLL